MLEPVIVQALYRASQAGVKIDLICRGICALRPQLPGISENIHVYAIIDRFLEHSRVFYFHNNGDPQVYIGSADWMDRNLSRRVEVVFPVEAPELKQRLIGEVLAITLQDNTKMRELLPDGSYRRITREASQPAVPQPGTFPGNRRPERTQPPDGHHTSFGTCAGAQAGTFQKLAQADWQVLKQASSLCPR